jgi:hypothetical protein
MLRLFKSKRFNLLLALFALVAVLTILLAPGYDLEPSADRAARAAALTMLSIVMAASLHFATLLVQQSQILLEAPSILLQGSDLLFSLRC